MRALSGNIGGLLCTRDGRTITRSESIAADVFASLFRKIRIEQVTAYMHAVEAEAGSLLHQFLRVENLFFQDTGVDVKTAKYQER